MEKNITKKQEKVLAAIAEFVNARGISPTFEELRKTLKSKGLELKSNNSLVQYLKSLEGKGLIERFSKSRGIRLLSGGTENFMEIPLLGRANCGQAMAFAENYAEDYVNISSRYIRGNRGDYFLIKAEGDSMDRENIRDGDLILVRRLDGEAKDGDVVVVAINGLATIKKFYKKAGYPVLLPNSRNLKHKPIILHPDDQIYICGKVENVFNPGV